MRREGRLRGQAGRRLRGVESGGTGPRAAHRGSTLREELVAVIGEQLGREVMGVHVAEGYVKAPDLVLQPEVARVIDENVLELPGTPTVVDEVQVGAPLIARRDSYPPLCAAAYEGAPRVRPARDPGHALILRPESSTRAEALIPSDEEAIPVGERGETPREGRVQAHLVRSTLARQGSRLRPDGERLPSTAQSRPPPAPNEHAAQAGALRRRVPRMGPTPVHPNAEDGVPRRHSRGARARYCRGVPAAPQGARCVPSRRRHRGGTRGVTSLGRAAIHRHLETPLAAVGARGLREIAPAGTAVRTHRRHPRLKPRGRGRTLPHGQAIVPDLCQRDH